MLPPLRGCGSLNPVVASPAGKSPVPGVAHGGFGVLPGVGGGAAGAVPAALEVAFHLVPGLAPVGVGGFGAVAVGGLVVLVGAGGVRVGAVAVVLPPVAVVLFREVGGVVDPRDGGGAVEQVRRLEGAAEARGDAEPPGADEVVDAIEHAEAGGGAAVRLGVLGLVRRLGGDGGGGSRVVLVVHPILLYREKLASSKPEKEKAPRRAPHTFQSCRDL